MPGPFDAMIVVQPNSSTEHDLVLHVDGCFEHNDKVHSMGYSRRKTIKTVANFVEKLQER